MHDPDCQLRTARIPDTQYCGDLPHDPHTSHIVFETFNTAEEADEVRAFAYNLTVRNRARKHEAERPANLNDVQLFIASIKQVIDDQESEGKERVRKIRKIRHTMDVMDVRECYVDLRACKWTR